ncbi:4-hydroxybenzoate solanesyltransferase [Nodularia sphaerocarpa]|uniref:4-hydroxybenzoate solanesyltransferase n=1 Tax=Nodularia sphaerocarpa TaxID=137816 RepID=UPI001EFBC63E|nr:4-hydroxybenzoate solanesyltransferase [Nodularia sphaerocarpa]MDB9376200.1 4-hydroxybenzoate solanesyltransferase [Nodularia sphaerocarpa CS-585]MDB9377627.1 4-hydroxybenzoate solanesyltransferase [Nodularia sphaerocarpa CS-585A2]ULP74293.1 4-hydroxybenzoate solanesyltransferase [Nodularia sphaerocarpa UHCC 0038]
MLNPYQRKQEPVWLTIIRLLRWHKPEGRLILMIPALWAVFLAASGKPPLPLVGVIVLGTLATSAAGCVVNDLWDRNIDPEVERTRDRPLASRALSIKVGIVVAIVSLVCAAGLALYLNSLSFWLSVAAVPVIVLYPGAKRVFPVPQLVLSIAWGFAVLISWSAVTQTLSQPTWLLWGATILWTLGFDTVYAMSDREDDRRIGVNSSALFFGNYAPLAIGIFFLSTVILLAWLGILINLNFAFWISLGIATIGWIWQCLRLRNQDLPNPVYGEMFRQNVWIGFILLAGMIAGSIFG